MDETELMIKREMELRGRILSMCVGPAASEGCRKERRTRATTSSSSSLSPAAHALETLFAVSSATTHTPPQLHEEASRL